MRGSIVYACAFGAVTLLAIERDAHAIDVTKVDDKPVRLDVTETSIVAQHFDAREGEDPADQGYGAWLNRLNAALSWKEWTVGARIDSSEYWLRPEDRTAITSPQYANIRIDETSRYRNAIYPAKLWATYLRRGLEVTIGDSYVQFGRGLVLSMRKIDELGIDNTIRGAKVAWQSDPFAVTAVAGYANPSRVDEATGRALFLPEALPEDTRGPQPLFGTDRIIGGEVQVGRGWPFTLSTHAVRLTRCAPYKYDDSGRVIDGTLGTPFGACDANDTGIWLSSVSSATGPIINANQVDLIGQGVEIPNLWGHGKIYVEGALENRQHLGTPYDPNANGNAIYASSSTNFGPVTNTLEIKSYRNFYPLAGAVDVSRAVEFNNIQYSTPPTTELITQDSEFGYFNACVDGGRLRTDFRFNDSMLLYGTGAYFHTKSENSSGGCDRYGHTRSGDLPAAAVQDYVWDGVTGIEWVFDHADSHLFASGGVRSDIDGYNNPFYHELHAEYAFTKHIRGPYSIEFQGRHRLRQEQGQNIRGGINAIEHPWHEGENYTALKVAPRWVFTQGLEYSTLIGVPTYYVNGSFLYRFTSDSNIRVFVGEQRGGLRCVSGVCKVFPAFEGARMELTLRF